MDNKKANKIMEYIKILGYDITEKELNNKYNDILTKYGEDQAEKALENQLKHFKTKVKEQEKVFWQQVKGEIFSAFNWCPCAIRDIKSMIKAEEIDITKLPSQTKIKKLLNIA